MGRCGQPLRARWRVCAPVRCLISRERIFAPCGSLAAALQPATWREVSGSLPERPLRFPAAPAAVKAGGHVIIALLFPLSKHDAGPQRFHLRGRQGLRQAGAAHRCGARQCADQGGVRLRRCELVPRAPRLTRAAGRAPLPFRATRARARWVRAARTGCPAGGWLRRASCAVGGRTLLTPGSQLSDSGACAAPATLRRGADEDRQVRGCCAARACAAVAPPAAVALF